MWNIPVADAEALAGPMMLQDTFAKIIDTFPDYREVRKTGGPWDDEFKRLVNSAFTPVRDTGDFEIVARTGQSSRAEIPWIGFRRLDSTINFKTGIYVAYLFPRSRAGVQLSLQQGVGDRRGRMWDSARQQRAESIRSTYRIPERLSQFVTKLGGIYITPRSYDISHICGRFYDRNAIPEDAALLEDLNEMLNLYLAMDGLIVSSAEEPTTTPRETSAKLPPLYSAGVWDVEDVDRLLEDVAPGVSHSPEQMDRIIKVYRRNKALAEQLKKDKQYRCERCKQQTGWSTIAGTAYVECHHLVPLGMHGSDDLRNLIVLCTDCHRFLHFGKEGKAETNRLIQARRLKKSFPHPLE